MIEFVTGSKLNITLEEMIQNADKFLWLISPFITLSPRIKNELKRIIHKDGVAITVVYGKNEHNKLKSLGRDDLEFFKEFPNIKICYEKDLHAKFYASEDYSLITSLNLIEFSQNNNLEVGIKMQPASVITNLTKALSDGKDPEVEAYNYFFDTIEASDVEFEKMPVYVKGLLGIGKKYSHSEVRIDINNPVSKTTAAKNEPLPTTGYCIRTGEEIPFNIEKPYCYKAFKTWNQFGNPDYSEKYCHKTGQESNGKTSMNNPIL